MPARSGEGLADGSEATVTTPAGDAAGLGRRAAVVLALGLAAAVIAGDQWTKAAITARYADYGCGNPRFYPVLGPYAGFSYVCNTGTAFSRFQGGSFVWLLVLLAIGAVLWLWVRSLATPSLFQQVAFGLIIGGAIGNVVDRVRLGYVVDFVDLRLSDTLRWYVFNVADASICVGVAILVLTSWRGAVPADSAPTALQG